MKKEEQIIVCDCTDLRHSIIAEYSEWNYDEPNPVIKELTISLQLVDNGFFYRLKQAWGYLFKKKSYPFDCVLLTKEHKEKFEWILKKIEQLND